MTISTMISLAIRGSGGIASPVHCTKHSDIAICGNKSLKLLFITLIRHHFAKSNESSKIPKFPEDLSSSKSC